MNKAMIHCMQLAIGNFCDIDFLPTIFWSSINMAYGKVSSGFITLAWSIQNGYKN